MAETKAVIYVKIQQKLDVSTELQTHISVRAKIQPKFENLKTSVEGFD